MTDYIDSKNSYTRRYIYDGEDVILELDESNAVVAAYFQAPGIDNPVAMLRDENKNGEMESDEIFVYTKDHLNSVKDMTDMNGNLIQRYNYSSYGITKIEKDNQNRSNKIVENPFAFTGRMHIAELGIYNYRARYYDPQAGRFISEDPIGFDGGGLNLYRYVGNNPVLRDDPSGLDFQICSRPLNMSLPENDPFRHYYIRFNKKETISYGVDENGNPTKLPEPENPRGETCGNTIKSTEEEDRLMKKWASQHYNDSYDPFGHNCKTFVGRATTEFRSAE